MRKLLLVVLAWMVLAGASGAQDGLRAGDFPAAVVPPEPGIVTLAIQKTRMFAYRLAGRMLGSPARNGMTEEEVEQILGMPDVKVGGLARHTSYYLDWGISVGFTVEVNATGRFGRATGIAYSPLLD